MSTASATNAIITRSRRRACRAYDKRAAAFNATTATTASYARVERAAAYYNCGSTSIAANFIATDDIMLLQEEY